jgi:hypothetical protein
MTSSDLWSSSCAALLEEPLSPYESREELTPRGGIEERVLRRLKRLGIQPARLCSDEVFLRRVYLDVIGSLPTSREARQFLLDRSPDRRAKLIHHLLEREEFADYWALKWCDLLRVKSEFPINLWPNAVQTYHRWIRACIRDNVPYAQFARELLTSSGSNFRVPPVNFYRAVQNRQPQTIARAVALTFMGCRAEKWSRERLNGMAAFFSQIGYKSTGEWKEEIVFFAPEKAARSGGKPLTAVFPDGKTARLSPDRDPREVFADWLTAPGNPWFARSIANRVWYWLLGRGIVQEPDDIRPDNPPRNPELLAYLEREVIAARYDLKQVFRLILNSGVYQLSSVSRSRHLEAAAQFASYPLRRLDAEVLIDALNQITGTTEEYSSPIPEPFTFIPPEKRSISLADGSVTSAFLEMFGRPSRDTGMESERSNQISAAQRLHLLNSSHIQRKIERGPYLTGQIRFSRNPQAVIEELYLTILSRFPTQEERKIAGDYLRTGAAGRDSALDIAWALINSAEFLYRH